MYYRNYYEANNISSLLILLVIILLTIAPITNATNNCQNEKHINVQQVLQNYSGNHHQRTRSLQYKWMDMRVFIDTSMMVEDKEACHRPGSYVRVGSPTVGQSTSSICSSTLVDNCWKLCHEADVLTKEKANYIVDDLIPMVVDWIQSTIKVTRVTGNIRIPPEAHTHGCADHLTLPRYYQSTGIPKSDLVLIVTGRPTLGHTVAWAVECASDQSGRPVFGHINIGPNNLHNIEGHLDYYSKIVLHELTHVLGFNSYKFPFYKDSNGQPYSEVIKTHIIEGKKIDKIVTPRVVAAAREHFGCESLDGVPLEDGGGLSTTRSHWEKRILRNEFMTGSSDRTAVISAITLALLEDTGWYKVDYTQAEYLEWGNQMGCNFIDAPCNQWQERYGYFCDRPIATGCTSDRKAMGYCNLVRHSAALHSAHRYFPNPELGGSDELADYCPYTAAFANGVCIDSSNQPERPIYGERFGENSKCFESSLVKEGFRPKQDALPMCYTYRCVGGTDPELEVLIGNTWHFCPFGGAVTEVPGFSGFLSCPNATFCQVQDNFGFGKLKTRAREAVLSSDGSTQVPSTLSLFLLFIIVVLICG